MAEDPIKLFAKRSERYPNPSDTDTLQGAARAVVAGIPLVGGSINEVLSVVLIPAVSQRRDEWLRELAVGLEQLEDKVEGFRVEDLVDNETFVSATIRATRVAIGTHQREKRGHLKNALINIAVGRAPEEEWHDLLMQLVDDLTPLHVRLLHYFDAPREFVSKERGEELNRHIKTHGGPPVSSAISEMERSLPELRGKRVLYESILQDLYARRLLSSPLAELQDGTVPDEHGAFQRRITNLGSRFLAFVREPEL